MKIKYTSHLLFRLKIRNIPEDLPKEIFQQARERYYDCFTKHYIAICRFDYKGKIRDMAVTYDLKKDEVELITVHPIKPYQKHRRVSSGRWRKYGK